jgi:hypothetical protein
MEVKKRMHLKNVIEQEDQKKTRKKENCENHVLRHLQKNSKWVIVAIIFDLIQYNIYPLFDEYLHLYIYDSCQSVAFLFYIYAIYRLIPEDLTTMHLILNAWLWFSIGDVINVVYDYNSIQKFNFDNLFLMFSVLQLSYKFKNNLHLNLEFLRFNLKIQRYEQVYI